MTTAIITIIASLVGMLGGILERRYKPDTIKKRNDHERDKEIAEKDHIAKSNRLSDLFDAVKLRNAKP
jgi:hypothetical protein